MKTMTLNTVITEIRQAINNNELALKNSYKISQTCNKPLCTFCERIGLAKAVFAKTKIMMRGMIKQLETNHIPRVIFDNHVRKEYGNYQAWILSNGHYINIWRTGGHSHFTATCEKRDSDRRIKVHAQGEHSNVIFYDSESPPTEEQIQTLMDIVTDSIMWNHRVTFTFAYDAHHPILEDDIPF